MQRYIDADKLSEEILQTYIDNDSALSYRASFDGDTLIGKMQVIDIISEQPTADVTVQEVRHGHWIKKDYAYAGIYRYECSECHHFDEHSEGREVPYCWQCGSKMNEVKDGTETN